LAYIEKKTTRRQNIPPPKKTPPKPIERIKGANCITWDARTGEVLHEEVL